jgi:hypothetical protein
MKAAGSSSGGLFSLQSDIRTAYIRLGAFQLFIS